MPPDPDLLQSSSLLALILTSPILIIGTFLPLLLLAGIVIIRVRTYRRIVALGQQSAETMRRTLELNAQLAARQEKMIALLTEIRDRLPAWPPGA